MVGVDTEHHIKEPNLPLLSLKTIIEIDVVGKVQFTIRKTMEINQIRIPKDWNGVSIDQWKEMVEVAQEEGLSPIDLNIEFISILSGIEVDDILALPLGELGKINKEIEFIGTAPEPAKDVKKSYKIAGKKYNVFKNLGEIQTSQYLDFQNYSRDMDKNIGEILAVFLIPDGHKYNDGYDLDETIKAIKGNDGIHVRDALALMSFFGSLFLKSILSSLQYSTKEVRKMMKDLKKIDPEMHKDLENKLRDLYSSGLPS